MENTGFLGFARRYLLRTVSFFLNFSQINNNIPYLLTAQKRIIFYFEIFVRKPLEN